MQDFAQEIGPMSRRQRNTNVVRHLAYAGVSGLLASRAIDGTPGLLLGGAIAGTQVVASLRAARVMHIG